MTLPNLLISSMGKRSEPRYKIQYANNLPVLRPAGDTGWTASETVAAVSPLYTLTVCRSGSIEAHPLDPSRRDRRTHAA